VEVRDLRRRLVAARRSKLRAAWSGRCRGWWQAALTKPGRVSTVRWGGSGERDGEEYARNRRLRLLSGHRLEPGGSGPGAVRLCLFFRAGNFLVGLSAPAGEATVKCCGVAVEAAGA